MMTGSVDTGRIHKPQRAVDAGLSDGVMMLGKCLEGLDRCWHSDQRRLLAAGWKALDVQC